MFFSGELEMHPSMESSLIWVNSVKQNQTSISSCELFLCNLAASIEPLLKGWNELQGPTFFYPNEMHRLGEYLGSS